MKLDKDGYVRATNEVMEEYRVTFEGLVFYESGGYVEARKISDAENLLQETRILQNKRNAERLNWLTAGLIVAALIALAWDVYKYYNPRTFLPAKHYIEQTVLTRKQ